MSVTTAQRGHDLSCPSSSRPSHPHCPFATASNHKLGLGAELVWRTS